MDEQNRNERSREFSLLMVLAYLSVVAMIVIRSMRILWEKYLIETGPAPKKSKTLEYSREVQPNW